VCVAEAGGTATNKLGQSYSDIVSTLSAALQSYDDLNLTQWDFAPIAPLVKCQ
jgi:5-methylthioadenosine/S-adenosylhomocysteine deaminase